MLGSGWIKNNEKANAGRKDARFWERGQTCEENRGKEGDQFGYDEIMAKDKSDLCRCFLANRSEKSILRSKEDEEGKFET